MEPSYILGTDAEKHLFSAQQQFLFAVFTQTLVDPTAKDILRRHQGTTDAQKIYSELVSAATNSDHATLAKQEILKFLTFVKLDHSWKGTHDGTGVVNFVNLKKSVIQVSFTIHFRNSPCSLLLFLTFLI